MIFKYTNKVIFLTMMVLVTFNSCKKENSVTLIETEKEIEMVFYMSISGTQIQTNAVAAHCQNDTMEFLIISNKEEHLDYLTTPTTFEVGDFVYYKVITDTYSYNEGVHVLGEDITGSSDLIRASSDANIQINSNDGNIISGFSEGYLFALDSLFQPSFFESYTMEFNALIVKESNYCDQ